MTFLTWPPTIESLFAAFVAAISVTTWLSRLGLFNLAVKGNQKGIRYWASFTLFVILSLLSLAAFLGVVVLLFQKANTDKVVHGILLVTLSTMGIIWWLIILKKKRGANELRREASDTT